MHGIGEYQYDLPRKREFRPLYNRSAEGAGGYNEALKARVAILEIENAALKTRLAEAEAELAEAEAEVGDHEESSYGGSVLGRLARGDAGRGLDT